MKRAVACSLAVTMLMVMVPLARAQSQGMGGMEMKSDQKAQAQTHKGSGTITKIDQGKSTVNIAHGPVQSMNWPAMTMTFKVQDKRMFDKVKEGDKVDFSFVQSGKEYTITQVK